MVKNYMKRYFKRRNGNRLTWENTLKLRLMIEQLHFLLGQENISLVKDFILLPTKF